jgi:hypothetical protein
MHHTDSPTLRKPRNVGHDVFNAGGKHQFSGGERFARTGMNFKAVFRLYCACCKAIKKRN